MSEQQTVSLYKFVDLLGPELLEMTKASGLVPVPTADVLRRKKLVCLYFAASWCPPCRKFTQELMTFYKKMKAHDTLSMEVVLVSLDRSLEDLTSFLERESATCLPVYPFQESKAFKSSLRVTNMPRLLVYSGFTGRLVSENGQVDLKRMGELTADTWFRMAAPENKIVQLKF